MIENKQYLTKQLITYIGNKRKLIYHIENIIMSIKQKLGKDKMVMMDGFAGSGIVGRMLKQHASVLYSNDIETYSYIINKAFLTNKSDIDMIKLTNIIDYLNSNKLSDKFGQGIIEKYYSPNNTNDVKDGERCFYTNENAKIIDNIRRLIDDVDEKYKDICLSLLLYRASVHTNTSGVFKGFYKSKYTKLGKFGGDGENALQRIMKDITIEPIILSNFECDTIVHQKNINDLVKTLNNLDIVYYDPPYNQHPYGSNYHMLNTICDYDEDTLKNISKVSGIPKDWNKSKYNYKASALIEFDNLIKETKSKFIILSYNNEGILSKDDIQNTLAKYGEVQVKIIEYNTFRGSRNLSGRNNKVDEMLWILEKNNVG